MAAAADRRNTTETSDGALGVGPEMENGRWTRGASSVLSFRVAAIDVPELSTKTAPWLRCMRRPETKISPNCPNLFTGA